MNEQELQCFLLETEHFNYSLIDEYSSILHKNWLFVKNTVSAIQEGKILGRGKIYNTVMRMAGQNRIPYTDAEAISAVIAERQQDLYKVIFNGDVS